MRWLAVLMMIGCGADSAELRIDLRTELVPRIEFDRVTITIMPEALELAVGDLPDTYLDGASIAQELMARGQKRAVVQLHWEGDVVTERAIAFDLRRDLGFTVTIDRECVGQVCPDGSCSGGACIPATCITGTESSCPSSGCTNDSQCLASAGCVDRASCANGICLFGGTCGGGLVCTSTSGCVRPRDDVAPPGTPILLYTFQEGSGSRVNDRSGVQPPLDVVFTEESDVTWSPEGARVDNSRASSEGPATRLNDAISASGEISIEAWVTPATGIQAGPARIITLSQDSSLRNFALAHGEITGSDGGLPSDQAVARLRTSESSVNGLPGISSIEGASFQDETRIYVVFTFDGAEYRLYLDGALRASRPTDTALPEDWTDTWEEFELHVANESQFDDRPWSGTMHGIAVFDRVISPEEIQERFAAGPVRLGPTE